MSISFTINQKPFTVLIKDYPIDTTLNTFIRNYAELSGTKFMCLEGGCGACICVIKRHRLSTNEIEIVSINSCLLLLNSCDGYNIITIEGIGNCKKGYHALQKRLAQLNGSQCGYCSPGFVMTMYGLLESKKLQNERLTMEKIEKSFGGNLCRCTGYRPILDAMKSFAIDYINIDFPDDEEVIEDIEDLHKNLLNVCKKSNKICKKLNCLRRNNKNQLEMQHIELDDNSVWVQAHSLVDIFDTFSKIGNTKYTLIAGGTAHGVYRRPMDIKVFIDVNRVPELHEYQIKDVLVLGGNLSITETMEILQEASKINGFEYCKQIYDHLDKVAHIAIGTLAGNISLKNQHPEFTSDIALLLETINAKIILIETPTSIRTITISEYLQNDMSKKVIKSFILNKYSSTEFIFQSHKIMLRAQNAHAQVNAGFLLQIDNENIIISARLCFGGIIQKIFHATNTEAHLLRRNFHESRTLQSALEILNLELQPEWMPTETSPDYRKLVACGLFYRFILSNVPEVKIHFRYLSGATELKRNISDGIQTFDTNRKIYPVSKPMPKIEALAQCSGEATYANDHPPMKNQLWAVLVHSKKANGIIAEIDPTEALKIPGVMAFYSAKDISGKNSFIDTRIFSYTEEQEIFASSKLLYYDQPVGVIVAHTLKEANYAASQVKIIYENLFEEKIMATLEDVLENKAWDKCKDFMVLDKSTKVTVNTSNCKFQGVLDMGAQYHFTMEPQTTVCVPIEDGLDVHSSTQHMDFVQVVIANALGIPDKNVYLKVRRLGGGYGAKLSSPNLGACACAVACQSLNKPIRFVQSIESMMTGLGKRYPCRSYYELEVNPWNGKVIKLRNTFWQDAGCTLNESPVDSVTLICARGVYISDGWKIDGKAVKTSAPSHTFCRAPGGVEGIGMIETIMEHIAREVNMDPIDVRMNNISSSHPMYKLVPEFLKLSDYRARRTEIDVFNQKHRWKKRGIGIALMQYPGHFPVGTYTCLISIYHGDGTISISHGGIEMGQGLNTKVIQIAAYTLNVPMDIIRVHPSDTIMGANSIFFASGQGTEAVCYATRKTCLTLLKRIKPIRDQMGNAKWEDIINQCYQENIHLTATEIFKSDDLQEYESYGLVCTEVEIDILTGNLILQRVDILEDAGQSLNPTIDVGQIEGGFMMGIGYWLIEKLMSNRRTGELLTNRTWNYKVPGARDIPVDLRVHLLQNNPNPVGILGAKRAGEPPTILSVSAVFAVRHALDSARNEAGIKEKWYHLGAPTTAEEILLAASNRIEQFKLQ